MCGLVRRYFFLIVPFVKKKISLNVDLESILF